MDVEPTYPRNHIKALRLEQVDSRELALPVLWPEAVVKIIGFLARKKNGAFAKKEDQKLVVFRNKHGISFPQ